MRYFRIILLPFMAILELLALAFCWGLAFINTNAATKVSTWCTENFPDREWYSGKTPTELQ